MTNQNTLRLPDLADAARYLDSGAGTVLLRVPGDMARLTRDDLRAIRTFLADPAGTVTLHDVRFTDADEPEVTR